MKKFLALLLSILLISFSFIACSDSESDKSKDNKTTTNETNKTEDDTFWEVEDATLYVKGSLDSQFLNNHDNYLKLVDITIDDCNVRYKEHLQDEVNYLANYFEIENITPEVNSSLTTLLEEIYSKSNYKVYDAKEIDENKFIVEVDINPINIISLINTDLNTSSISFNEKYAGVDISAMTAEEYAAYDLDWANLVLNSIEENISKIDYLDTVSLNVEVFLADDGLYNLSDDYSNIINYIIQY